MFSKISSLILRLFGWEIDQTYPRNVRKAVIAVIPHTSNWDFPLGILTKSAIKLDVKYLGKSSLFRFPFGRLFRWLGGYPVDRSKQSNFVDAVVDLFNQHEDFIIAIAPEGTRGKVNKLKTGFYYIALGAKVPIVMIRFDYKTKKLTFSEPLWLTGDFEADMARFEAFFEGVVGKNPELGWGYSQ